MAGTNHGIKSDKIIKSMKKYIFCFLISFLLSGFIYGRAVTIFFKPGKITSGTIKWQNGKTAVSYEVGHTRFSTGWDPPDHYEIIKDYNLYISLYVYSDNGKNNYYGGCTKISLGNAGSGELIKKKFSRYCDDVTIKGKFEKLIFHDSHNLYNGKTKGFEGKLKLDVDLGESCDVNVVCGKPLCQKHEQEKLVPTEERSLTGKKGMGNYIDAFIQYKGKIDQEITILYYHCDNFTGRLVKKRLREDFYPDGNMLFADDPAIGAELVAYDSNGNEICRGLMEKVNDPGCSKEYVFLIRPQRKHKKKRKPCQIIIVK